MFVIRRKMGNAWKIQNGNPLIGRPSGIAPYIFAVLLYNGALETISLSFMPLPPSNLRPFGAPPSIGRRECPREPLPLEGAAERSEAGLASFLGGEAASSLPSLLGKALCREKRYPRIVAFPIGEGGPRQRRSGALVNDALETIFFASFIP